MRQPHSASALRTAAVMVRSADPTFAACCLLLTACLVLAGCQTAKVAHPLTAELSANDPATQLDFWQTLAERPVASNDEAFHGLLLFTDGSDPAGGYADRVTLLKGRKMLPHGFDAPAEQAISRGDLAVALCRILNVKGGVMMRLTGGDSGRYGVRELEAMEVYPPSSPNQTFSGMEFLGVIGRIEDYQRGDPNRVPATVMPSQAQANAEAEAAKPAPATRPAEQVPTTRPLSLSMMSNWTANLLADLATQPTTEAADENLQATITAIDGIIRVRMAPDQPWQPAKVGMVLGEGAEFQTGPKSAVQFRIPPDQTITLDRLGAVSVLEAVRRGGSVKTDLGMKFGRVRYAIEAAGVSHDSTIHSPGSTLAVRGTITSLTNTPPFAPMATSITGRVWFKGLNGQTTLFGGTNEYAYVVSGAYSPAESALGRTYVDPIASMGRSDSEEQFSLTYPVIGAFTPSSGLTPQQFQQSIVGTPTPPVTPTFPTQQGSLIFFLTWAPSQTSSVATGMDLSVVSPRGELLSTTGPRTVPSGGIAPVRDPGTRGYGEETAAWQTSYPLGTYSYSVQHLTGGAGEYGVAVFRDGQLVSSPNVGSLSSSDPLASFNIDIHATANGMLTATPPVSAKRFPTLPMIPQAASKPQPMGPLPASRVNPANPSSSTSPARTPR